MLQVSKSYESLLTYGIPSSPRGSRTLELISHQLEFGPTEWFIDFPSLPLNWDYVKTELKWYIKGSKEDLSIVDHANIWAGCVDKDGKIQSNYGYYFHRDFEHVKEILRNDPETRRAVITIADYKHVYDGAPDVPCTMYLNFMIRDGALNMHVHMRSQDCVFGLRNDLPAFQMFKLFMADAVEVPPGRLYLTVDSFHVYDRHMAKIADAVAELPRERQGFTNVTDLHRWLYVED